MIEVEIKEYEKDDFKVCEELVEEEVNFEEVFGGVIVGGSKKEDIELVKGR